MGIKTVQVREFECERCGWKWVRRINGKDIEGLPFGCARCKSYLWNTPRQNHMLQSSYWLAKKEGAKAYAKEKFLDLYNTRTQEEWFSIGRSIRDDITQLAAEITAEQNKGKELCSVCGKPASKIEVLGKLDDAGVSKLATHEDGTTHKYKEYTSIQKSPIYTNP